MPSSPTTTMISVSLDNRSPKITDHAFEAHPLLLWMKGNGRLKAAEPANNIEETLRTSQNSTVQARDYKTPIPFVEQDPLEVVEIPFRHINGSIVWYKWQEQVNESSKQKIFDFVDSLVEQGEETMGEVLGQELWQAGAGEHWHGLPAILSATNTYMGKNRSLAANAYFRAKVGGLFTVTKGGTTRSFGPFNTAGALSIIGGVDGGIQALRRACGKNGGTDTPDFATTTEALYARIESLIEPTRIRQNSKMVELGWDEHFVCQGMIVTWDANTFIDLDANGVDDGSFIALNSNKLKYRPSTKNKGNIYMGKVQDLEAQGLLAYAKIMNLDGNLTCVDPGSCGALTGKTA